MGPSRYADTRARGRAILAEHLGLEDPAVPLLLRLAEDVLGSHRVHRCVELIRASPLSQRYRALAAVASLVAGTEQLGESWWTTPHAPALDDDGPVVPDDALVAPASVSPQERTSSLDRLSWWIADACAEETWGRPTDFIDLNDPRVEDRIASPSGASAGDRMLLQFDPGGVVDAVIEMGATGALGTRLALDSCRHSIPAEVDWAWAVALPPPGPFPLPGEEPDPYATAVDQRGADRLRAEGVQLSLDEHILAERWSSRGDVCSALAALDWPWLPGDGRVLTWGHAVTALLDGA